MTRLFNWQTRAFSATYPRELARNRGRLHVNRLNINGGELNDESSLQMWQVERYSPICYTN